MTMGRVVIAVILLMIAAWLIGGLLRGRGR